MTDIASKAVERSVERIVERWAKRVEAPLRALERIHGELERLGAPGSGTDDAERRARCAEARAAERRAIDEAGTRLRIDLSFVTLPADAPLHEVEELCTRVERVLEQVLRALPRECGLVAAPDVALDPKGTRFERLGLRTRWIG